MPRRGSHHDYGASSGPSLEWDFSEIGIAGADLKAIAVTTGKTIEVSGMGHFMAVLQYVIAGTAPTVGTAKLEIEGLNKDGLVIMPAIEILQVTSTQAAGTYYAGVAWGSGTPDDFGGGTTTITAANFDRLKTLSFLRVRLNVTVAFDAAGTKTGSVLLIAKP